MIHPSATSETSALSVLRLAEIITDVATRALDADKRMHHESDAVMYGKINQISAIADLVYLGEAVLTYPEEKALAAAQTILDKAFDAMADAVGAE